MRGWKTYLKELLGVLLGVAVLAASFNMFLIPNKIAAGGASGLGIILFHLFHVPVGLTVLMVNIPLFILAWYALGWRFVAHSLAGTLLLPLLLELMAFLPVVTRDLLLASIYGGIGVGVGLGLVFRSQGSTGGTALGAQLIHHYFGLSSGQGLIFADLAIVLAAGFIFSPDVALFALLSIFITSRVIDLIQEGPGFSRAALIISDRKEAISQRIIHELDRGATFLEGSGAYTGEKRGMILCVVPQHQVTRLKNIVRDTDPKAFVIVSRVGEVMGEGFKRI